MRRRRPRTEAGASAVEFALVLPFLALLLFGLITTGLTYSDHLSITNATREGARLGSAIDFTTAGPTTWAASVKTRVEDVYFNAGGTLKPEQICVKLVDEDGNVVDGAQDLGADCGSAPDLPSEMAPGSCAVMVWVTKPADIELIVAPTLNFNIGSDSVSYYGRVSGACTAE